MTILTGFPYEAELDEEARLAGTREYPEPTEAVPPDPCIDDMLDIGFCTATDGCEVDPDGVCPHGHVSWLVYLGFI